LVTGLMPMIKVWVGFCAMLTLLAACNNPEQTSVVQPQETAKVFVETGTGSSVSTTEGTKTKAFLVPSPLRTLDTAQARVSGCSGPIRYAWEVNGRRITGALSARLTTDHYYRGDEVAVIVDCDGTETHASTRVANSPPQVLSVVFRNINVISGEDLELIPEVSDPEDDYVDFTVRWQINGEDLGYVDGLILPGEYVQKGQTITIFVTPRDSFDEGRVYRALPFAVPDGAPHFITKPPASFTALEYTYLAGAEDPDGDLLTYRLEEGPPGMTVDQATGAVHWKIEPGTAGEFQVQIAAQDPGGSQAEQTFSLTLSLQE
jgi:hypothetical protein